MTFISENYLTVEEIISEQDQHGDLNICNHFNTLKVIVSNVVKVCFSIDPNLIKQKTFKRLFVKVFLLNILMKAV